METQTGRIIIYPHHARRPAGEMMKRHRKGGFILNGHVKGDPSKVWIEAIAGSEYLSLDETIYLSDSLSNSYEHLRLAMDESIMNARGNEEIENMFRTYFRPESETPIEFRAPMTLSPLIIIPGFASYTDILSQIRKDIMVKSQGSDENIAARLVLMKNQGYYSTRAPLRRLAKEKIEYLGKIEDIRTFFKRICSDD